MIRCSRCLIPTTRPDTAFSDNVCSACTSFDKRKGIDWRARRVELERILAEHGGRCIVPSSGGKDSTWQVLTLLEMGADVTVVTATTCMLTPVGRANIDNLKRFAPTIELSPNARVRAKLNRIGLEMVGDISWPEHVAIHRAPFRVAADLGIPLIFYGECPNEAYGGPPGSEENRVMTQRWASEFGGFLGLRAQDLIGTEGLSARDMAAYTAPTDDELREAGVTAYFLGQFFEWDSHRNAEVASEHGFKSQLPCDGNWWKFENVDNAQTGLHDWFGYLKYGYGRAAAQLSVDIRVGRVMREAAMAELREREGPFPSRYMDVHIGRILAGIGMSSEKFVEVCNAFVNHDLFVEPAVRWGEPMTLKEFANA